MVAIEPVLSLRQRSFLIQLAHTPACLQASISSVARRRPPQWHCCGVARTVVFVPAQFSVFLHQIMSSKFPPNRWIFLHSVHSF